MAGTGRLDRIAALTDLLAGVGGRQRGEPIEAEQWNTIVDVIQGVLEIDRAQENGLAQQLIDSFSPLQHEHLGQVSFAWLDADLQNRLVAGGGTGPVTVRGAITDVKARVGDLSGVVSTLSTQLETIQKRNDDTAVDELTRASKLRSLETRFTGVEDLRAVVTTVSAQVQDLSPQVQTVLELRSELSDDAGVPINVRAVAAQVGKLDAGLAEATSGVDGTPLRLRDLQVAVQELQDVAGTGTGGLDQRLATLGAQLQGTLDTRLDERLNQQQQDVAATIDQRFADLEGRFEQRFGDLQRAFEERIAGLADEVTQKVFDQVGDKITENVLAKVTDQVGSVVDERLKERLAEVTQVVGTLEERVARLEQKVFG